MSASTALKEKFDLFKEKLEGVLPDYRRWAALGILLALLIALPVTLWGFTTARFETRKRAATGEVTPTPTLTPLPLTEEPWMANWKKFWSSKEAIWQGPEVSSEWTRMTSVGPGSSLKFKAEKGTASLSEGRTGLRWRELPSQRFWEGWVYSDQARKFRIALWVATTEGLKSKPLYTTKQAVQGWNHVEVNVYEAIKSISNAENYKNFYIEIYVNEGNTIWLDEVVKEASLPSGRDIL